jgi:hypothetical protein
MVASAARRLWRPIHAAPYLRRNYLTARASGRNGEIPRTHPALVFAVIFVFIFLLHAPLLRLPYFWDEAGYYIPAARDLLLTGSLIPHSTVSNAHPPLVLAWLALWWKVVGFTPIVTRTAMLVIAAFSLLGLFRLAERVANPNVAIASTLCTALYPVFFAQSSLAHVDLASAGLIFWALSAYVEDEFIAAGIWFALAALAKETAIIAPLALAGWEVVGLISGKFLHQDPPRPSATCHPERSEGPWFLPATGTKLQRSQFLGGAALRRSQFLGGAALQRCIKLFPAKTGFSRSGSTSTRRIASLLFASIPLTLWYVYHYRRTGYVFGNPEFFRYNVAATLSPLRFVLALALRLWQVIAYLHLWFLTLATFSAMWILPPLVDSGKERPRIRIPLQLIFYVVVAAYVVAMALIGGAVLARYMLPAVPLVILLCVSTLWRRVSFWPAAIACVALAFVAGWFWNPRYGFSPEDNLAYRDYILLHEDGEHFLEARYPMARVLTAWPASDEITRPWLGYITRPMQVVRLENFSWDEVISAAELRSNHTGSNYEAALIFSTKYEPGPAPWDHWRKWNEWKSRFFDFHHDLPPAAAAQILGGRVVFSKSRQGQWIAVIEMERNGIESARGTTGKGTSSTRAATGSCRGAASAAEEGSSSMRPPSMRPPSGRRMNPASRLRMQKAPMLPRAKPQRLKPESFCAIHRHEWNSCPSRLSRELPVAARLKLRPCKATSASDDTSGF